MNILHNCFYSHVGFFFLENCVLYVIYIYVCVCVCVCVCVSLATMVTNHFHCMEKTSLNVLLQMSSFVFDRQKEFQEVWNDMRVNK